MTKPCRACGQGTLTEGFEYVDFEYKNVKGVVPCKFSTCDYCLGEYVDHEESVFNVQSAREFRAKVDLMENK